MSVPGHEFIQPIHYGVDFMRVVNGKGFTDEIGVIVHVITSHRLKQDGSIFVAIPPGDDFNLARYLAEPSAAIVGRGILVEEVGTNWFVAWRPFSPKPEIDTSNWER